MEIAPVMIKVVAKRAYDGTRRIAWEFLREEGECHAGALIGWVEATELIIKGTNGEISAKTVTYDFERLMEGATSFSSSASGDALVAHM